MSLPNNLDPNSLNPALNLEGLTLKTGWKVLEKVPSKPGSTGGHFSVCYLAEKDGTVGFLKAINFLAFFNSSNTDLMEALGEMTKSFNFEKELLTRCRTGNFSKVARLYEADTELLPGYLVQQVPYLIFEKAEGDVRAHLNFTQNVDIVWKLRSLHNVSVGLKQLHGIEISHQDLKPSNIFIYPDNASKLGDLGRSLCKTLDAPHSNTNFAGDRTYSPPEVMLSYFVEDWHSRVFAIDCYLLGNMIVFYFCGVNINTLVIKNIDPNVNILMYNGRYKDALPYLIEGFDRALKEIEQVISHLPFHQEIISMVRCLCNPEPEKRGHQKNILSKGIRSYNLERFVAKFDLLASKAEHLLTVRR